MITKASSAAPNTPPALIAAASIATNPVTGTRAQLSVSDPDGDILTYTWQATTKPSGATPQFQTGASAQATFDQAGSYVMATDKVIATVHTENASEGGRVFSAQWDNPIPGIYALYAVFTNKDGKSCSTKPYPLVVSAQVGTDLHVPLE